MSKRTKLASPVRQLELAILAYRKQPTIRNERRLTRAQKNLTNQGRI